MTPPCPPSLELPAPSWGVVLFPSRPCPTIFIGKRTAQLRDLRISQSSFLQDSYPLIFEIYFITNLSDIQSK